MLVSAHSAMADSSDARTGTRPPRASADSAAQETGAMSCAGPEYVKPLSSLRTWRRSIAR
jgi:hypothetical protein